MVRYAMTHRIIGN